MGAGNSPTQHDAVSRARGALVYPFSYPFAAALPGKFNGENKLRFAPRHPSEIFMGYPMKNKWTATMAPLLLSLVSWLAADGAVAAGAEARGHAAVRSPEVTEERRVTFRLQAPAAQRVSVTGDFGERIEMSRGQDGIWTATTPPLPPDLYGYNFVIDGVRTIDPRNPVTRAVRPSAESIVAVRGEASPWFEAQAVPHGAVHLHWYHSAVLGQERPLYVYTPPGYEREGARTFPVVYLLHGAGEDVGGWANNAPLAPILDNLTARRLVRPMIVVMPLGHVGGDFRMAGPQERERAIDLFARELRESIISFAEAHYRVSRARDSTAIAGLSMGGAQALRIGLAMPERFGAVGAFGPAISTERPEEACPEFFRDRNAVGTTAVWLGCGRADSLRSASLAMRDALLARGVTPTFFETDGAHTWVTWRACLIAFLPTLFAEAPRAPEHGSAR